MLKETWIRFLQKNREKKRLESKIKKTRDLKKQKELWKRHEKICKTLTHIKEDLIKLTEYEDFFAVDTQREIVVAKERREKKKFYHKILKTLGFEPSPEIDEKFFPVYLEDEELIPLHDRKYNSPHALILNN